MAKRAEHRKPPKGRLTRDDWAKGTLEAIAESGLAAATVEAIAERLGATKGSFYWHFKDRDELIQVALALWEESATEAHIRNMEALDDAHERFAYIRKVEADPRRGFNARVEAEMLAAADNELVQPVIERVIERRIAFMQSVFEGMGFGKQEARDRALLSVAAFFGRMQLRRAAPRTLPSGRALQGHLDRTAMQMEVRL